MLLLSVVLSVVLFVVLSVVLSIVLSLVLSVANCLLLFTVLVVVFQYNESLFRIENPRCAFVVEFTE